MPNTIGKHTYATSPILALFEDQASYHIGKFCSISTNLVLILGGNHPIDTVTSYPFGRDSFSTETFPVEPRKGWTKGDIVIGNDVWIGLQVTILSGIHVGDGAVIGAYSVVTKDIPPYAIVSGNPARIKKYRFSKEIIDRLIKLAWWNWDDKKVLEAIPLLYSKDIEAFLALYESHR